MSMDRKTLLMAGAGFAIATAGIVLFMKAQKEKKFKAPTSKSEWSWSDEVKRLTGQLDDFPYGSDQIYIEFSLMDNKTQEKQLYELSDWVSAGILYHDKESLTDEIIDALGEYSEKQGWPYEGIDVYSINIEK